MKTSRKNLEAVWNLPSELYEKSNDLLPRNLSVWRSRWVLDLQWVIPIIKIVTANLAIPVNTQRETIHRVPPMFIPKGLWRDRRRFSGPLSTDRQSFLTARHSFPSLPSSLLCIWHQDTLCLLYYCEKKYFDLRLLKPNENVGVCAIYPEPERTFPTPRTRENHPQGCCTSARATEMGK